MKKFGRLTGHRVNGNIINLEFENGTGRLEIITDRIINVFSPFESEDHRSKAIEGKKALKTAFTCEKQGAALVIGTAYLTAKVWSDFKVDFYRHDGKTLCRDYRGTIHDIVRRKENDPFYTKRDREECDKTVNVAKALDKKEVLLGLGDKAGFIDKRGYEYKMWNSDVGAPHDEQLAAIYKSIPFYISKKTSGAVYGIFFDNSYKSVFNMGKNSPEYFFYAVDGGNLDYYFIGGDGIADIVGGYTYLTGTTPLPQRWTLGHHQSRWGYMDEEDMLGVAHNMRKYGIPCDAIHFDIDYMEQYKIFTWNTERYKDPAKTLKALKKDGFKTVTIIDPAIKLEKGYPVFDEGIKNGYFATDANGLPYVNAVWAGDSLFPDFGKKEVRTWWGNNLKFHTSLGVDGIWNDMNEPACSKGEIPDDVIFHDENRAATHAEMHNVYAHNMDRATFEGLKEQTGKRPFVITRACFAGTQKYATAWTGDNRSLWSHLRLVIPQLCSLGLCGMSFVGTDIGGFCCDTTPELLCRWVEAACFSPLFRNHSDKWARYQEPWRFGDEVVDIYRKFVKLRYAFIPYIYDLLFEGEKSGLPVMRPLALHYENDEKALRCNSEYLVGEKLLVAPVLEQGASERAVYLPRGEWYDMSSGKKFKGKKSIVANAPIDVCPMYAKAGAIFPSYGEMNYVGEKKLDTLIIKVFRGNGEYYHYEDNGEDYAYRKGEYNKYRFEITEDGVFRGSLVHNGYKEKYKTFTVEFEGKTYNIKAEKEFEIKL